MIYLNNGKLRKRSVHFHRLFSVFITADKSHTQKNSQLIIRNKRKTAFILTKCLPKFISETKQMFNYMLIAIHLIATSVSD